MSTTAPKASAAGTGLKPVWIAPVSGPLPYAAAFSGARRSSGAAVAQQWRSGERPRAGGAEAEQHPAIKTVESSLHESPSLCVLSSPTTVRSGPSHRFSIHSPPRPRQTSCGFSVIGRPPGRQ